MAASPRAIRLAPEPLDPLVWHTLQLGKVARRAEEFDVLHFHTDFLHYPFSRQLGQRSLTTLHGRLDLPDLAPLYREFTDIPVISISNAQRAPLPWANWQATVYHGLPDDLFEPSFEPGSYLAFLGRLSPEKRPDWAIEIARRARSSPCASRRRSIPPTAPTTRTPWPRCCDQPHVEMVGEVGQAEKGPFLAGACALVFPVDWPEPFGLVMIEALACGTPVIAFRRGSIPEVIEDGVTGFVVDSVDQAVEAVGRIGELDRRRCRAEFMERFSARRMAADYVALYERMIEGVGPDWVDRRTARPTRRRRRSPRATIGTAHPTSSAFAMVDTERTPRAAERSAWHQAFSGILRVEDRFYILATSSLADDRPRVMKQGDTFALFDHYGDIKPVGLEEEGVYHEGTRFLSSMVLRFGSERPMFLSSTVRHDGALLTVDLTNPDITEDGRLTVPRGTLHIQRSKLLWQGVCYERLVLRNYGRAAMRAVLAFHFAADFADIFEVRGLRRRAAGPFPRSPGRRRGSGARLRGPRRRRAPLQPALRPGARRRSTTARPTTT